MAAEPLFGFRMDSLVFVVNRVLRKKHLLEDCGNLIVDGSPVFSRPCHESVFQFRLAPKVSVYLDRSFFSFHWRILP